jgi:16S rRNA (guanine527-N7)-methyltransferase
MSFLKTLLAQGLINEGALQRLGRFVDLILEWNGKINLTGLRNRAEIEEILIGEAVLALQFIPISSREILDFGSGAGIPGLVWALCEPDARVTSLDSTQKKVAFQKDVLRETGGRAEILWGRFPKAVGGRHFDIVVSRALRFSPVHWEEAAKLLYSGGHLVRFTTPGPAQKNWTAYTLSERSNLLVRDF